MRFVAVLALGLALPTAVVHADETTSAEPPDLAKALKAPLEYTHLFSAPTKRNPPTIRLFANGSFHSQAISPKDAFEYPLLTCDYLATETNYCSGWGMALSYCLNAGFSGYVNYSTAVSGQSPLRRELYVVSCGMTTP